MRLETDNHKRNGLNYTGLAIASTALAPLELYGSVYCADRAYKQHKELEAELAEVPKGIILSGRPLIVKKTLTKNIIQDSCFSLALFLAATALPYTFFRLAKKHKRLALEKEVDQ